MMINRVMKKYNSLSVQVKAAFLFTICSFLQRAINVLTTPIYTRLLSTSEYGQYGVFNTWLSILSIFVTLNLAAGVNAQGLVKFEDDRESFSSSLQGLSFTLTIIWTIIYLLFKDSINFLLKLTTTQMLCMLVIMWSSAAFNFWANEKRTIYKYKLLIIVSIVMAVFQPLLAILLIVNSNDKVTAKILGIALVQLIFAVIFFTFQLKRGKKFYSKKYWKYALKFNIPLIPHYLSQTVLNGSDKIMIERMIGISESGIYSLAYSLSMIMTLFNTALGQTLNPWIYQKIKDRKEKEIAGVGYACLTGIAILNLVLIGFAPEAVKIFAPNEYYDAIYVIPPVAMSVYFMFAYDLFAKFEFYYEKTSYIATATVISAFVNVVTNYIFINKFGYQAAGYTTLFCYILYCLFHYIMMKRINKEYMNNTFVYNDKIILLITTVFMCLGFIFLFLYDLVFVRYILIASIIAFAIAKRKVIISVFKRIVLKM